MAQAQIKATQPDLSDFFGETKASIREIKALGADYWEMDNGSICKVYEASRAPDSDQNRMGIIPVTHSVDPGLIPRLKDVKSWPCVLQVEIITVAGSKNKSTTRIISVSGVGV